MLDLAALVSLIATSEGSTDLSGSNRASTLGSLRLLLLVGGGSQLTY